MAGQEHYGIAVAFLANNIYQ
ncbi:hypothetical protein EYZ11_001862 [Aspergillus tanneri]|uniref:Uncharacterized protein n=1 Tax=Aspergillus tanneri TaxID=1220188 RepID=A0A4S3JS71_9EURO|nr:hypothetical protein EYZ11_001862 [Aspergillus tanneri]